MTTYFTLKGKTMRVDYDSGWMLMLKSCSKQRDYRAFKRVLRFDPNTHKEDMPKFVMDLMEKVSENEFKDGVIEHREFHLNGTCAYLKIEIDDD